MAIDGPYKGFKSKSPISTDGSREIVRIYRKFHPNQVELYTLSKTHERVKRQKYVDIASKKHIKWLLILDSDEFLTTLDSKKFIKELVKTEKECEPGYTFGVSMLDTHQNNYRCFRPRLWYRPELIHYKDRHSEFDAKKLRDIPRDIIEITHSHSCRPEKRQEQQQDYVYRLAVLEQQYC